MHDICKKNPKKHVTTAHWRADGMLPITLEHELPSPSFSGPSPSSTELETLVEDREVEEPWEPCRGGRMRGLED